jgi:hypothetical protein
MFEIKNQKTKTTACRENGADSTSGNFILAVSHKKKEILMIIPALLLCSKIRKIAKCQY